MSAAARSLVYLGAMAFGGHRQMLAVVLVEAGYVTLTAGLYAGLQQRALGLRSKLLGNLVIVIGVPGLAQGLDWTVHSLSGAAATGRATLSVSVFAALSALFHLHVMRNGVFLTGYGRSLLDDFRRIPRLVAGFLFRPMALLSAWTARPDQAVEPETAS